MLLNTIADQFQNNNIFKICKDSNTYIEGISPSSFSLIIASEFIKDPTKTIVICSNNTQLNEIYSDLSAFLDSRNIFKFPAYETLPYEYVSPTETIERDRVSAINIILKDDPGIFITCVEAVIRKIPPPEYYSSKEIELAIDEEYPFSDLIQMFSEYGYERVSRVESFGEFSVKGGIIDIYPPGYDNPIRLDFFDEFLESIREFDIESQKSLELLDSVHVIPRKEIILTENEISELTEKLRAEYINGIEIPDHLASNIENSTLKSYFNGIEDIFSSIKEYKSLSSYVNSDDRVFCLNESELKSKVKSIQHTYHELYKRKSGKSFTVPVELLIDDKSFSKLKENSIVLNTFTSVPGSYKPSLKSLTTFKGKISLLRDDLNQRINQGWKIIISTAFEGQARRLSDLLAEFEPDTDYENYNPDSNVNILLFSFSAGIEIESMKTVILTDHDIFGKSYRKKKTFKKKGSRPIDSFLELEPGDYVVHINHGIGVFKEISRMKAGGIEKDFLVIEYADSDVLFVALDQLNMIQKYIGFEGKKPRIDNLGKKSAWNRIKAKVQKSVEEIAEELIQIYAKRKALKGFSFPPDTVWQEEFEANFEYEETPDQLTAIEDVKDDMESVLPMDRLVCGDVGFGKTEVAIRAAFKCSMAGKQTALLVPTTVLAMQHYNTFKKRFKDYPVSIGLICRFRSRKDINAYKAQLSSGQLDIIIGTHALLADDIFFKNIGLLIIDEEQKFGVKHKEKIKRIKSLVDVMTLSATPIPRTLHMSLAGIRDLSIIATPPENRQNVETYVLEENPDILKMAVEKELARGGQVFYIHNRVQTIDSHAEMLQTLVPEADIIVAHGQMPETQLEEIMVEFIEGKHQILISTTIIESGLDMPNVNTIIIDRADTFGLSQLYQLKGRVGRSSVKAFAYLFYPRHTSLTETAQKRLQVISEHSELGSGFKIAMKDLEIRGSGNILGKEQSGNIMDVGFDLYCQMLEETVSKLKGEKQISFSKTSVFLKIDTFIPDEYISDQKQKIEFYKKFEASETVKEVESVETEITDRFGKPHENVQILISLEKIKAKASELRIVEIIEGEKSIRIKVDQNTLISTEKLLNLIKNDNKIILDPQEKDTLIYRNSKDGCFEKLNEIMSLLERFSNN